MSLDLDEINSGYNLSKINSNFQKVENELNKNVLRRNGLSTGEDNVMHNNLDMNSFAILNAKADPSQDGSLVDYGTFKRALRVPVGEKVNDLPNAALRSNKVIAFDGNGQPVLVPMVNTPADIFVRYGSSDGDTLIGSTLPDGSVGNVHDYLSNVTYTFPTVEALKASVADVKVAHVLDALRGGVYRKVTDTSRIATWTLNGAGDIYISNSAGVRYVRDTDNGLKPEWFGARPGFLLPNGAYSNESFDNTPAFTAMQNVSKSMAGVGYGAKHLPFFLAKGAGYAFGTPMTIDNSISIIGNGAVLFAVEGFNTSITSERTLFTVYDTSNPQNFEGTWKDFTLLGRPPSTFGGTTTNAGITAILHSGTVTGNAGLPNNARLTMNNVIVNGFYRAETYINRAYLVKHTECKYIGNNNHYRILPGADAGENISYVQCLFANGGELVQQAGTVHLYGCSIDYTRANVTLSNSCQMTMFGGHIENDVGLVTTPFINANGSAKFNAFGTTFWPGGSAGTGSIDCLFSGNGWMTSIKLSNCWLGPAVYFKQLYNGTGTFDALGTTPMNSIQAQDVVNVDSRSNFASPMLSSSQAATPRLYIARFINADFVNGAYSFQFVADPQFATGKALVITKNAVTNSNERICLILPTRGRMTPHFSMYFTASTLFSADVEYGFTGEVQASTVANSDYGFTIGARAQSWSTGAINFDTTLKKGIGRFGTHNDFVNGGVAPRDAADPAMTHMYLSLALGRNMPVGASIRLGDINAYVM